MAYTKTTWVNNQAPAINADNLNKIEDGIYNSVRYADAQTLADAQKKQARANIAAAPDGFGLGANGYPNPYTVVTGATINTLNESGLFWYRDIDTPIYPDGGNSGVAGALLNIAGNRENTLASRQIFYPHLPYGGVAFGISCMRVQTAEGEWQPWEWVNPPMQLGVEYRTTERYLGKPVYVKLINLGNLPNNTEVSVQDTSIGGIAHIVDFRGEFINQSGTPFLIPYGPNYADSGKYTVDVTVVSGNTTSTGIEIRVYTTADLSAFSATTLVKYTKFAD